MAPSFCLVRSTLWYHIWRPRLRQTTPLVRGAEGFERESKTLILKVMSSFSCSLAAVGGYPGDKRPQKVFVGGIGRAGFSQVSENRIVPWVMDQGRNRRTVRTLRNHIVPECPIPAKFGSSDSLVSVGAAYTGRVRDSSYEASGLYTEIAC